MRIIWSKHQTTALSTMVDHSETEWNRNLIMVHLFSVPSVNYRMNRWYTFHMDFIRSQSHPELETFLMLPQAAHITFRFEMCSVSMWYKHKNANARFLHHKGPVIQVMRNVRVCCARGCGSHQNPAQQIESTKAHVYRTNEAENGFVIYDLFFALCAWASGTPSPGWRMTAFASRGACHLFLKWFASDFWLVQSTFCRCICFRLRLLRPRARKSA